MASACSGSRHINSTQQSVQNAVPGIGEVSASSYRWQLCVQTQDHACLDPSSNRNRPNQIFKHPLVSKQAGRWEVDEPAASALAVLLTELQGPSVVPITAAECRTVSVALMADAYEVPASASVAARNLLHCACCLRHTTVRPDNSAQMHPPRKALLCVQHDG